jgi:excisionase family DNA binding protein
VTPTRIEVIPPAKITPLAVGARDAARMLGVCEKTIRTMAAAGELPSARIGTRLILRVAALEQWLRDRETTPADGGGP